MLLRLTDRVPCSLQHMRWQQYRCSTCAGNSIAAARALATVSLQQYRCNTCAGNSIAAARVLATVSLQPKPPSCPALTGPAAEGR